MITAKRWWALYILVFLGYNNNAGALTFDYSKDRLGVMEGVQTDTIFADSDTTGSDTSVIRYNAGEDKWEYTNDGENYYNVGNVTGPDGCTESNIAEFDDATGELIKDGGLFHDDVSDAVDRRHDRGSYGCRYR